MTARQVYEAILIELHKEHAPNIFLEDFNYLFNKAINQYVNKRYNIYDVNQQTTDDLRVLKASAVLPVHKCDNKYQVDDDLDLLDFLGATYEVVLPSDYLHILNCICIYKVNQTNKCYDKDRPWRCPATRLTADAYSLILDNFWLRPTYRRPYYYIHNVNKVEQITVPTDPRRASSTTNTTNRYYIGKAEGEIFTRIAHGDTITNAEIENILNCSYLDNSKFEPGKINAIICPKLYNIILKDSNNLNIATYYELLEGTNYKIYRTASSILDSVNPEDIVILGGPTSPSNISSSSDIFGTDFINGKVEPLSNRWNNNENSINIFTIESGKNPNSMLVNIDGTNTPISTVERTAEVRYGNTSTVRMEIRYGSDDSIFSLKKVLIDYIKVPLTIRLTLDLIDRTADTSQVLEFPDYVCQEIINELTIIVMENISDPRLQTSPVVSLSIANPAQQLTEPVALTQQQS